MLWQDIRLLHHNSLLAQSYPQPRKRLYMLALARCIAPSISMLALSCCSNLVQMRSNMRSIREHRRRKDQEYMMQLVGLVLGS